jgi:hypothetical protein
MDDHGFSATVHGLGWPQFVGFGGGGSFEIDTHWPQDEQLSMTGAGCTGVVGPPPYSSRSNTRMGAASIIRWYPTGSAFGETSDRAT